MTATIFERKQKMFSTVVVFVPANLLFFICYGLNLCSASFLLFIVLNYGQEKVYFQCISHLHIFYSVQVQSTGGMSVFPVATEKYNRSSTMLFAFSFRG